MTQPLTFAALRPERIETSVPTDRQERTLVTHDGRVMKGVACDSLSLGTTGDGHAVLSLSLSDFAIYVPLGLTELDTFAGHIDAVRAQLRGGA